MKKIYRFRLIGDDIDDGDNNDFSHPFYTEIAGVIDPEDVQYMRFSKDKTMFITIEDSRIKEISAVFAKHFILSIADISDDVLACSIQHEYPDVDQEYFDEYRLANTTMDDVLDKINKSGMCSLDHIDKTILESNC
jgi:hypothetical protein